MIVGNVLLFTAVVITVKSKHTEEDPKHFLIFYCFYSINSVDVARNFDMD